MLTDHLGRFGVTVERGVALTALSQSSDGVMVQLGWADGSAETATARYVIGCDGAHSAVRHALGIGFEGDGYPMRFMLGDVHIAWDLPRGMTFRSVRLVEGGRTGHFYRYSAAGARPLPLIHPGTGDVRDRW